MKVEIKSWFNGGVLFSLETESLKLCLEAAIKQGANLQGADLQGANLQGANLQGADLQGANLQDADLQGADLQGADLQGANLQGANLQDADLQGADLQGADLRGADLQGADLRGADLRGANLRGAKNLKYFPIQVFGHRHFLHTTQDGRLAIGCEIHTFDEWLAEGFAEKLGKDNGYSALDVELYKLHIAHIEKSSRLLWNAKKEEAAA